MVVVLAFQIFSVLRTQEDESASFPLPPRREADREVLQPAPPEAPPEMPPKKLPVDPNRLIANDPFDWRERASAGAAEQANVAPLRLLRIRSAGDSTMVQIETDSSRKWYQVGEAFESYELLSVDPEAGTAEIFDESLNRTRVIALED